MKPTFKAASIGVTVFLLSTGAVPAGTADEVTAAYRHFVEVQNAHDISGLADTLSDSPDTLFVAGSTPIWGREALLARFETLYKGTLHFDPDYARVKVDVIAPEVARLVVPVVFLVAPPGQKAQPKNFLVTQVWLKASGAWKLTTIVPSPAQ
jgi:uncharacterized protein (TIGR02246 family)